MKQKTDRNRGSGPVLAAVVTTMIILLLGVGVTASAQTAQVKKSKSKKTQSTASMQQAAIDPQTGELRQPTAEDSERLASEMKKKLNRSPEKLSATQLSDGTLMMELPEEYMDVSVVKINPDGTMTMTCVKGKEAADAFVKAESKTASAGANKKAVKSTASRSTRKAVKAPTPGGKE